VHRFSMLNNKCLKFSYRHCNHQHHEICLLCSKKTKIIEQSQHFCMKDILKFNKSEIQLTLKSKSVFIVSS